MFHCIHLMCVHHVHAVPMQAMSASNPHVTELHEAVSHHVSWGGNLGPMEDQPALLTSESSFQESFIFLMDKQYSIV